MNTTFSVPEPPDSGVCKKCGHCDKCGRGGHQTWPYYQPYGTPYYPITVQPHTYPMYYTNNSNLGGLT